MVGAPLATRMRPRTLDEVVGQRHLIGPVGQGIAPSEFAEVIRMMRYGVNYVNVHTNKHPGGEIRGQVKGHGADD